MSIYNTLYNLYLITLYDWLKLKKEERKEEGDNRDMDTLYDWLKCKQEEGKDYRKVTLIYEGAIIKHKRARIKQKPYGYSGHYMTSTLSDEKAPEYYPIDYLLKFIEEEFLRDYCVISDKAITDDSPYSSGGIAYELVVTDRIPHKPSYSKHKIDPSPVKHNKEYSDNDMKVTRDAWDSFMYGEKRLEIKKVVCNGPATIILWSDGTKTIAKCDKDDALDYEKGILYAALKKLSNKEEYNNILRVIDALEGADVNVK